MAKSPKNLIGTSKNVTKKNLFRLGKNFAGEQKTSAEATKFCPWQKTQTGFRKILSYHTNSFRLRKISQENICPEKSLPVPGKEGQIQIEPVL